MTRREKIAFALAEACSLGFCVVAAMMAPFWLAIGAAAILGATTGLTVPRHWWRYLLDSRWDRVRRRRRWSR